MILPKLWHLASLSLFVCFFSLSKNYIAKLLCKNNGGQSYDSGFKNDIFEKISRDYERTVKKGTVLAKNRTSSAVFKLHPELNGVSKDLCDSNSRHFAKAWSELKKWASGNDIYDDSECLKSSTGDCDTRDNEFTDIF